MSRATELASGERWRAARRPVGQTGGVKNRLRGDKRSLRRRREDQEQLMDEAIEKLLLELTHNAFSVLRIVCVRV